MKSYRRGYVYIISRWQRLNRPTYTVPYKRKVFLKEHSGSMRFIFALVLSTVAAYRTCETVRQEYGPCCEQGGCSEALRREYQQHGCCHHPSGDLCHPDTQYPLVSQIPSDGAGDCNDYRIPNITVLDNCGILDVIASGRRVNDGPLVRTWKVRDTSHNAVEVNQTVWPCIN